MSLTASKLVQGIPRKLLQFGPILVQRSPCWTIRSATTSATTAATFNSLEQLTLSEQLHGQQSWRLKHTTRTMSSTSSKGSTAAGEAAAAAAASTQFKPFLTNATTTPGVKTKIRGTAAAASALGSANRPAVAAGAASGTNSSTTKSYMPLLQAGLPLILFTLLGLWVTSHAYGGKLRELEASRGQSSVSLRQAALAQEHDAMMERLNHIAKQDFDNTKRIARPEEILEQRRLARQRRNAWHRRAYRWIAGIREEDDVK
jgi:hypothetical protein